MKTFNLIIPKKPLIDAVQTTVEFPGFSTLTKTDRECVGVGDGVKLGCEGEWFWVEIMAVRGGKLYGRIDNDLKFEDRHGLSFDAAIEFETRHIREVGQ